MGSMLAEKSFPCNLLRRGKNIVFSVIISSFISQGVYSVNVHLVDV